MDALSRITPKMVVGTIGLGGWVAAGLIVIFRPETAHGQAVFQSFNSVALLIAGYYFGSSDGSAAKSVTIADHLARQSPAPAPEAKPAEPYKMPPLSASPA